LKEDIQDENENDVISAGDFEAEFEYKKTLISGRSIPKKGFFEKVRYFDRLFPSLKI